MIATLTLILSAYLAVLSLGDIYLLLAHRRHRIRSLNLERADTARAVVPPDRLPAVCVHLPVYNARQKIDVRARCGWKLRRTS